MKPKILFNLLTVLGLALVLITVLFTGTYLAGQANAQEGGITAQGTVGTAFTYQGRLNNGSNPADGIYDFVFLLFDVESGSSELAIHNVPDQDVNDGYFSVQLDFGSSAFTGQERWLEIRVKADSETSYTTLTPRVNLLPTPYAQSLRPGAVISGSESVAFSVKNSFVPGFWPWSAAIAGYATGDSEENRGVMGLSYSDDGVGVYGEATSQSSATDHTAYGGKFVSRGWGNVGVYGEDSASGANSYGYGVYGKSNSSYGYGVYSDGDAHVEGALTWRPKTSYISIPAAAFIPQKDINELHIQAFPEYLNDGESLRVYWSAEPVRDYVAPVQLPHGATLGGMYVYFSRASYSSSEDLAVGLYRKGKEQMAYIASSGQAGTDYEEYDDTINFATVDNGNYTYYISATLKSAGDIELHNVIISYEVTHPY